MKKRILKGLLTCACGDSYVSDRVDALGHAFVDGSCTTCGTATPNTRIAGDINGAGKVNNKDVTRLFQYLTGYDVEIQ